MQAFSCSTCSGGTNAAEGGIILDSYKFNFDATSLSVARNKKAA